MEKHQNNRLGMIALDYDTRNDTLSLCPGRLEKALVVEALQEAAFFVMDGPAPTPEGRNFREHVFEGDQRDDGSLAIPVLFVESALAR
jgi:hypothetical protein